MISEVTEIEAIMNLSSGGFISEIYNRYGKKLYGYAIYKWKVSEDDAWDLVYQTLYKVVETRSKYVFDNEAKLAAFIFRVFVNCLRNHYRDNKEDSGRVTIDSDQLQNQPQNAVNEVPESNILKLLNEELDKMEDWQRMLLLLRSDGMSYAEIARYVDKPENQLKVYYQRLKDQVSRRIHERL